MVACPVCATESPEGFRFCPGCGTALPATPAVIGTARSPGERKAVTALFCDLVGFTSLSESADPEDVDRMLATYFALARGEIERHGGTVEKFIGDAVVGMFGAPVTHEDDPERAVRAALRIAEGAAGLAAADGSALRLRIGINTGETLVHVGAAATAGEALVVGDAINTAARIQAVAPEMGVAVGLSTWQTTHLAIEYDELPPARLKGKAEPVRIFHATAVRARLGVDLSRSHAGAYVGRDADLGRLRAAFDDAAAHERAAFVAVVGEPGIGKSRILAELAARILTDHPDVVWRQGRCLPYGDGITFWALGEIVKAHAGILEGDTPETVTERIEDVVRGMPAAAWLRDRLLPLVGVGALAGGREELFAAWRSFLAGVAAQRPAVVVFEDIHWADEALLAFLGELAAAPPDAPLLVLMTARPSLSASLSGVDRIDLLPLTDDETERLIGGLLGTVIPPELHEPIVARAQGNPLYAEEFIRLLVDRDLLVRSDGMHQLRAGAQIPLPESIAGVIGARLDSLPPGRKALLADAAVIGKVFWSGAVAAMAGRTQTEVEADLAELARIELVRPAARSSMAGEAEYAFWHVLARDVAYQQLPRGARASRHQEAGDWLEAKAGERIDDIAQVLAHHYATALDLARAAGDDERARTLEPCALRYLRLAGERALGLDTAAAMAFLERALALAPTGHPERHAILAAFGDAADHAGRHEAAATAFEEAISGYEAAGDRRRAARLMLRLQLVYVMQRDRRMLGLSERALAILTAVEPSEDLVHALTQQAIDLINDGDVPTGIATLDRALAVADRIGMPPPARTLRRRGHARLTILGDRGGSQDYERAIAAAKAAGDTREVGLAALWFGSNLALIESNPRGRSVLIEGLEYVRARGLASSVHMLEAGLATVDLDGGRYDEALERAEATVDPARAGGAMGVVAECLITSLGVQTMRGEIAAVRGLIERVEALQLDNEVEELWLDFQPTIGAAYLALGDRHAAAGVIERVLAFPHLNDGVTAGYRYLVGPLVELATELRLPIVEGMLDHVRSINTVEIASRRWAEGSIARSRGDETAAAQAFADAAEGYGRLELRPWEARMRLDLGRSLAKLGRQDEADQALAAARAIFDPLRATPWITACDEERAALHR